MSRINIKDRDSINLEYITNTDTVGKLIDKLNRNFKEIQINGGGPMGPEGKIGPPGCRGQNGAPGKDGENISDEWIKKFSIGCDDENLYNIEDVIVNKKVDRTLLLTNLFLKTDVFKLGEIGINEYSFEFVVTDLSEYKLKIYNSDKNGKGNHIHLANSLAMLDVNIGEYFRCKSGFSFSLDWNNTTEERLKLIGEKNINVVNHKHIFEIDADEIEIRRDLGKQSFIFDAGANTSNFSTRLTLDTLTTSRNCNFPDRSGYVGVWEDTNEHSESWEIIGIDDILITFARYNPEFSNYEMGIFEETGVNDDIDENDEHYVFMDDDSVIRFKRLNNWVLIDFHIGVSNLGEYDNFYLRNIQFKVNKKTLGCKTLGWHPLTIVQDEEIKASDYSYSDFGLFKISSGLYEEGADTFLVSLRLKNESNGLPFINNMLESYWFTGQVWATVQTDDTECVEFDINQEEYCPELQI